MPEPIFDEVAAQRAFDALVDQAKALAPEQIEAFRGEALLAYHNVKTGAANVLARERDIANVPGVDVQVIKGLPNIAMAVVFAADKVNRLPAASELSQLEPRVADVRRRMLSVAISLAECGLLPKRDVDAICAGRGRIDRASDTIQLSALLRKHWEAIQGKHPLTEQEVEEAGVLGTRLLSMLRPSNARRQDQLPAEVLADVEMRDRMWTLLVRAYNQHLWRAGAWLFGQDVEQHVPALLSRQTMRKKADEPPVSPPAAG